MLEAEEKRFAGMAGWYESRRPLVATTESIRRVALGVDPWDPVWHDEEYARGTSRGSLEAYPTYQAFFGETGIRELQAPPECGQQYMIWMGEDWEFFRPVLPGDVFRIRLGRPQLFDVTPLDGTGPRTLGLVEGDLEYFVEHDRPSCRLKNYVQRTFQWDRPRPNAMPLYSYTREELEYLGRLMRAEEIRGAAPRYWEDVEIGEEPTPIVTGPTNMGTNSLVAAISPDLGDHFTIERQFYLGSLGDALGPEFILDPATGRYLLRGGPMGRHYSDLAAQAEGEPCAWLFGIVSRYSLLRVITNWMGDEGFVRAFKWRHMTRTRVGDAIVGQGTVVGKRIARGEHLVDLHVWLRNLRGNVSEAAVATVRLPSRREAGEALGIERAQAPGAKAAGGAAPAPAVGERVRIRPRPEWPSPPGFRFAGAEGMVVKWVEYDDAMTDFRDVVVCVRLENASGEAGVYVGSTLLFRPEDVEPVHPGAGV
jgi:hypothetical protein